MDNMSEVLGRAARIVNRFADKRLKPFDLTTQQFIFLKSAFPKPIPMTRLAEVLGCDRTTASRNSLRLEKRGLICYARVDDKRINSITLTPQGLTLLQNALPVWKAIDDALVDYIEAQNIEGIISKLIVLCKFK